MSDPPQTCPADSPESSPPPSRRRRRDWLWLAVCWAPYALLARKFYFLCDDAFISFRYAKNWAAGHGLRYNLGEHVPVEGYSNFLWVSLATLGELAELDLRVFMPAISFLAGTLLLGVVFFVLRRSFDLPLSIAVPAALFLACSPSFAVWSTGGLETAPFALLIFLACRQLILRRDGPAGLTGGLAGLALALIRVEGFYWALLLGLLAIGAQSLQPKRRFRPLAVYFLILVLGYGIYYACRYAYYQSPVPNTAYVKVDFSATMLERGWNYAVVYYLTTLAPLVALLGLPIALLAKPRAFTIPMCILALAFPLFAVVVGGDFMTMGRLIMPGLAFHAIVLALLLRACAGADHRRAGLTLAGGLALVLVGALPAWDVHLVPESIKSRFHFRWNTDQFRSEFGQWAYMADNVDLTSQFGRIMKEISAPGDSIVADSIGALGYYSDLFVYDLYGLVSREVTRADRARGRLRSPGHDLRVPPAFFLPYGPTYLEPITVPHGPEAARTIRAWADKWQQRVDPNLYAPEIVNTGRITGNPQAPLLAVLRRPRNGVSAEQMWSRFQTDLRLWSVTFD